MCKDPRLNMTVLNVQGHFEQDPSYTQNCVKKKNGK